MNINNINKKNSREWIKVNDDAQSHRNREAIVAKHGGRFFKVGTEWKYASHAPKIKSVIPESVIPKAKWIFIHPDGKEELVENLSKFCRKHELNKAAMYEVYNGKRNHHKNFKLKKQGD